MYLYHHVPANLNGNIIYPLNQLKEKFPDLYKQQYSKYDNIKEKDVEIPGFGFWNDCINLMPVDPRLVKVELERFGHDTNWEWKFYKINSSDLDESKLIFMIPTDGEDLAKRVYAEFNRKNYDKFAKISKVTKYRFQKAKKKGIQPNTFAGIPHVLYKASIDTSNLEIVIF